MTTPADIGTFTALPGCEVLVKVRGIYNQYPLYRRNELLYLKTNGGFIRMLQAGQTSVPKTYWVEVIAEDMTMFDVNPLREPTYGRKKLAAPAQAA